LRRWPEGTCVGQVVLERPADRSGYVTGYRVDGLHLAPEPLLRPGVDQHPVRQRGRQPVRIDEPGEALADGEIALVRSVDLCAQGDRPGRQPAIQHRHGLMTQPAQAPPGSGCIGAAAVVVNHHLVLIVDTQDPQPLRQPFRVWQRVATPVSGGRGQIVVQAQKAGTCDMAFLVGAATLVRIG
jgi:hypothetical protein